MTGIGPFPVDPLPPGCPWSGWTLPNLKFCEENLCAWVTAPANTWSNLAYILVGLWLWSRARREDSPALRIFAPAAIFLGLASGLYHASYTYFFQTFDHLGMYMIACLLLTLNLRRLGVLTQKTQTPAYLGLIFLSTILMFLLPKIGAPIQALFAFQVAAAFFLEVPLIIKSNPRPDYRYFVISALLFGAAYVIWTLDYQGIVCDPRNHLLQGHATWHVITALCVLTLHRFYRQFRFAAR